MTLMPPQPAPAFAGPSTHGPVSDTTLAGRVAVVYFYPKDSTPGCTTEAMAFRDLYNEFRQAGAEVVGVSRDSIASHERFAAKLGLPFPLISDTDESVCHAFDVIKSKKLYGKAYIGIERSTFLIDGEGMIRQEWRGVRVPQHAEEVLECVRALSDIKQGAS